MPNYTMKFSCDSEPTSQVMVDLDEGVFVCCGDEAQSIDEGGQLSDDDFHRLLEGRLDVDGWTMVHPSEIKGNVYQTIVFHEWKKWDCTRRGLMVEIKATQEICKALRELVKEGWVTRGLIEDREEAVYRPAYATGNLAGRLRPST